MTIAIAPATLSNATKAVAYSVTLTATGGTGPYTFSVLSGALPSGLTLSSGGVLSGTPTTPGYYSFIVRATDSVPATGDQAYTVYVAGVLYWFICTNAAYPSAVPVVAGSQHEFNRRSANAIAGLNRTRREVGDLFARPNSTPVNNALLCDGSAIGRASFPQLFGVIGTDWGTGNGTTTFNIPNLIGSLPIAATAPTQTIGDTTVSTGGAVTQPSTPAQVGGTSGGNVISGGRTGKLRDGTELP